MSTLTDELALLAQQERMEECAMTQVPGSRDEG